MSAPPEMVSSSRQLAAARQIDAAIAHYLAGEFECAITLCSAGEGIIPEPAEPIYMRRIIQDAMAERPLPGGQKDDLNYLSNWLKHGSEWIDECQIARHEVLLWLNRAISKYRATYGAGTVEMAVLFPWAA